MCYTTERFTKDGHSMHTCNGDVNSGLPFGRKAPVGVCRRCDELRNGAVTRSAGWDRVKRRQADEEQRAEEIKAHYAPGGRGWLLQQQGLSHLDTAFEW